MPAKLPPYLRRRSHSPSSTGLRQRPFGPINLEQELRKGRVALGSKVSLSAKLEDTGEGHDFAAVRNLGPTRHGESQFEAVEVII